MPKCICGHTQAVHTNTECTNERCHCTVYVELCPRCLHAQPSHQGGECTRIKTRDREPCGCTNYPAP